VYFMVDHHIIVVKHHNPQPQPYIYFFCFAALAAGHNNLCCISVYQHMVHQLHNYSCSISPAVQQLVHHHMLHISCTKPQPASHLLSPATMLWSTTNQVEHDTLFYFHLLAYGQQNTASGA